MEPILTIDNLNSFGGNMLRQGDKSELKYRLRDVGNKNLSISGKSCEIVMYGRNYTTVVYETTASVSSDNTVSFTIDKVLPKGTFYLEFTVGDYIFPTDHREYFEITPSGKGVDANIIEIVGKDVLINAVKSQVDTELQPLVTSLESAEQAETQRASAESARVSAEEQRKIDHANRSAELVGKADKVVLKNLTPSAVENWTTVYATTSLSNNEYTLTVTSNSDPLRLQSRYVTPIVGHKYYVSHETKPSVNTQISTHIGDAVMDVQGNKDTYTKITAVLEPVNTNPYRIYVRSLVASVGDSHRIRNIMSFDMTEIFGAGNEPTKEEMDRLIEITGYIDGEYALNNKEMLGRLMNGIREKADKKQEDWITPTLLNGATGDIQFRKNQFGRVEFRGKITGYQGSSVFVLPTGYRPRETFRTLAKTSVGANESRTVMIQPAGSVYFEQPYGTFEVYFDTISFSAE